METKDTNTKLPYVAPEITVIKILTQDVITTSGTWFDDIDNGADDDFTIE